jgi:threonine/homoserine efflux transporter RhtA
MPPRYGDLARTLQHWLEKAMLALLFLVPVSGFLVDRAGAALVLHVGGHIALYVVVGAHVALQLAHRHVRRLL